MVASTTGTAYWVLNSSIYINPYWTLRAAIVPILAFLVATVVALSLLVYPPPRRYKKLCTLVLAVPVVITFNNYRDLMPWPRGCDLFGRFLYIWMAHMSYEINIVEFEPKPEVVKENARLDWKIRLKQASKVIFTRPRVQASAADNTQPKRVPSANHGSSRAQYVLWQAGKLIFYVVSLMAWDVYDAMMPIDTRHFGLDQAYFFRRMFSSPSSLNRAELWHRMEFLINWIFLSLWEYEGFYSAVSIIWVGVLRIDPPAEWPLYLCNSILEAWSVRRYWGDHWHDYISVSFSEHAKIVTRKWIRLEKGKWYTRLLENSLVFGASGVAHSLVRWREVPGAAKWCIAIFYTAQMVPIVIEAIVQGYWRKTRTKWGIKEDDKRVNALEKTVGYAWVAAWFMWIIPKCEHIKNAWAWEAYMKKRDARLAKAAAALKNETG